MISENRSHFTEVFIPLLTILSDVIAIEMSFLFAYKLRFSEYFQNLFPLEKGIGVPSLQGYLILSLMVIPVWILIFQSRKLYRPRRTLFIFDEFFLITRLVTFGIIFSFGLIFFYRVFPYSRLVFVLIWFFSVILITFGRYMIIRFEKSIYSRKIGLKNAVIVGSNDKVHEIFSRFYNHPYAGYKIAGILTDNKNFAESDIFLGSFDDLYPIVKKYNIESVLLTLTSSEHDKLYELMKSCEGENVEFLMVPDFLEMITSSVRVHEVDGIPFLKLKSVPMNVWNKAVKRLFDILFSFLILALISPILLITSVLVKFTSRGSILYKQERLSMTGRKFNMYKFRSMVSDAEKDTGAVFATKNDTRYTPIGLWLRKYSIDELPQFINVLFGDMSIVGPRPEREYFINLMKDKIPKYLERHRIKCGITGWAQVNGLRGTDTPLEKRIEYDIYYIENWSLVFDLKIIFKTIREMFFSKTAF
jgi:exopolysaccharide biosynthesis polyprenyl glycosylphosphotransferase